VCTTIYIAGIREQKPRGRLQRNATVRGRMRATAAPRVGEPEHRIKCSPFRVTRCNLFCSIARYDIVYAAQLDLGTSSRQPLLLIKPKYDAACQQPSLTVLRSDPLTKSICQQTRQKYPEVMNCARREGVSTTYWRRRRNAIHSLDKHFSNRPYCMYIEMEEGLPVYQRSAQRLTFS
jgi:hypothetical protein